ncbi:MAG: glycosyltransferase [Flavobacteriales bacterium]|jgi:glycosyltransferase involved in cell wall biosynthesis|tara:strand:- start:11518 stop:12702 length:1185 start_codon:yes stop_codon:yes gene_type:complete
MKIGMILDAPYPPDPRVTNEAKALIKSGNEISLFCLSFKKPFIKREVINGINIERFYCSWITFKLSALAYTFPFYKWIMSKKIKFFIKSNNIESLHVHDLQIASSVFFANFSFNLNITLDLHENRPEIMKFYKHVNSFLGKILISPSKWRIAEEKYCKMANSIIVVTDLAKRELIGRININEDRVVVFSNSVSKSFYSDFKLDNNIFDKYSDSFVLLYLGNTSKRRGLETVLKSIPEIIKSIFNFKLVIVGSSSYDNELIRIVSDLNISKYVDFEGWKDEALFPSYIKAAQIGISPLHSNLHHDTTYANKLFQYMSLGCPVICSDVMAQKILLDRYDVGLVFESENSLDLIEKLIKLYLNKDLRIELSKNCIHAIENHLNNDIISKSLVKHYDK